MKEFVKRKGNRVTKYLTDAADIPRKAMKVTDNGNGFTVKSYSWSSAFPNTYHSIGYGDAADLVDCLELMDYRDD